MTLYMKALEFAKAKHEGQVDKSDVPYIEHPIYVASLCEKEEEKIVALLHDTVEDTDTTIEEIKENFGETIANNVNILTHEKGVPYFDYIKNITQSKTATIVKLADLTHNMDLSRLKTIKKKDKLRYDKYKKAYSFLELSMV